MKFLTLTTIIMSATLFTPISGTADPLEIRGNGCGLRADGGNVEIIDRNGQRLMLLSGMKLTWSPPGTAGGEANLAGPEKIRVDYRMSGASSEKVKLYGEFSCHDNRIEATFVITAPADIKIGGAMELRRGINLTGNVRLLKTGLWQRNKAGGMAIETNDGMFRRFDSRTATVLELFQGNHNWVNDAAQHLSFEPTGKPEEYRARTTFAVYPPGLDDVTAAAAFHGRPLAVDVSSNLPFNFNMDGKTPLRLKTKVSNAGETTLNELDSIITVRDFEGKIVEERKDKFTLTSRSIKQMEIAIPSHPGAYFAEASVHYNGQEYFSRTSLGVAAKYEFKHLDSSIFGIAAYWEIPDKKAIDALLRRMGVHWIRRGDSRETVKAIGAEANWHSNVKPLQWSNEPQKKLDWMRKELNDCDRRQNPYWEFGNEWNMSERGTGKFADNYVNDWLKPLAKIREEGNFKVKLLSMGLAGADLKFLKGIYDNGGWPLLSGIAFHPGRGNFAPDYLAAGWTYLGSIRRMKEAIGKYGDKPLWVTEAYACTLPHSWWHDSLRRATENVILTYVLGMAEGIKAVMFYQMQDGTGFNPGGINLNDHEYHYGLLDRKGAVKPLLLAYCAISDALDGANFRRYISFNDKQLKGVEFDTPRGRLAVLWHRADGYIQSVKSKTYTTPEPWLEHWKTRIQAVFETTGTQVTIVDCIGRKWNVAAKDGRITLDMTGSPIMVYGLSIK